MAERLLLCVVLTWRSTALVVPPLSPRPRGVVVQALGERGHAAEATATHAPSSSSRLRGAVHEAETRHKKKKKRARKSLRSESDDWSRPRVAFERRSRAVRRELRLRLNQPGYEIASSAVTLLACGLFAVRTLPHLDESTRTALAEAEIAISTAFACEWAARWFANGKLSYLVRPLSIVDLISFLPAFVDALQDQLSFLRLFRVLRLQRLLSDTESFAKLRGALFPWTTVVAAEKPVVVQQPRRDAQWTSPSGRLQLTVVRGAPEERASAPPTERRRSAMREETFLQLSRVLSTLFTLLFVSSGLIYTAEHDVNPEIPDFFTALYFGLTTLTTVGFGDITPLTPNGRLIVSFSILVGIGVIPVQVTSLAESLLAGAALSQQRQAEPPMQLAPPVQQQQQQLRRTTSYLTNTPGVAADSACRRCGLATHSPGANFCSRCGAPLPLTLRRPPRRRAKV